MGYSYSSSEVNWTIYNCPVTNSFGLQCYPRLLRTCGVPLAYSTSIVPKNSQDADTISFVSTLSPFRGLFIDHKRPLHSSMTEVKESVKSINQRTFFFSSGSWTRTNDLQVMSLTSYRLLYPAMCIFIFLISILFYKDRYFILIYQIFCKKNWDLYLNRCLSQFRYTKIRIIF